MKATGIVRRVDDLGRIVVPKEIRKSLSIKEGDPLEIFTDKDIIKLKRYYGDECVFCKNTQDTIEIMERCICKECVKRIRSNRIVLYSKLTEVKVEDTKKEE